MSKTAQETPPTEDPVRQLEQARADLKQVRQALAEERALREGLAREALRDLLSRYRCRIVLGNGGVNIVAE